MVKAATMLAYSAPRLACNPDLDGLFYQCRALSLKSIGNAACQGVGGMGRDAAVEVIGSRRRAARQPGVALLAGSGFGLEIAWGGHKDAR